MAKSTVWTSPKLPLICPPCARPSNGCNTSSPSALSEVTAPSAAGSATSETSEIRSQLVVGSRCLVIGLASPLPLCHSEPQAKKHSVAALGVALGPTLSRSGALTVSERVHIVLYCVQNDKVWLCTRGVGYAPSAQDDIGRDGM